MQRLASTWFVLCMLIFVSACRDSEPQLTINEEGCVSAAGNEFILTDLHPGARSEQLEHLLPEAPRARPTTEAYLLSGDEEELRKLVGRRVHASGVVDPARVAELRSISPMVRTRSGAQGSPNETPAATGGTPTAPPQGTATSGTASGEQEPRVATQHQLRLEVHHMRLISIEPTGDECGAMRSPGD